MPARSKIKEIVANRIVLETPKGKLRAVLDATSESHAGFTLRGANSELAMSIQDSGRTSISFMDKDGRTLLGLGLTEDEVMGHGISVNDREGRMVCLIRVSDGSVPSIALIQWDSENRGEEFWKVSAPRKTAVANTTTKKVPKKRKK